MVGSPKEQCEYMYREGRVGHIRGIVGVFHLDWGALEVLTATIVLLEAYVGLERVSGAGS